MQGIVVSDIKLAEINGDWTSKVIDILDLYQVLRFYSIFLLFIDAADAHRADIDFIIKPFERGIPSCTASAWARSELVSETEDFFSFIIFL